MTMRAILLGSAALLVAIGAAQAQTASTESTTKVIHKHRHPTKRL
jgi:hypothetical protein